MQLLFTTGIWSGGVDSNGRLAFNFFNKKNIIYSTSYLIGSTLFIWRYTIPTLQEKHDYSFGYVVNLYFVHYILIVQILGICFWTILNKMKSYVLNKRSADLNITSQAIYTVIGITMNTTFMFWIFWHFLPWDIILCVSVFILFPMWIVSALNIWISPMAFIALLKSDIIHVKCEILTVETITHLKEQIDQVSKALAYSIAPMLASCQIFIVVCVYLCIKDINNIMYMLMALAMTIFIYKVLTDLEDCYEMIDEVVKKAKRDACEAATIKEMMALIVEAELLKETCPFSAARFFTLELSTMTAMLATTLTYLVVLLQSF